MYSFPFPIDNARRAARGPTQQTMFESILDEEERGQVGIGTLIVFIAMVLVAAIAAGVLINTAGFLQTQAEATGEESTSQVSDRIQVVSQSGNVSDQQVDNLTFVLAKAPGAGSVDLNQTTLELVGEQGQESIQIEDLDTNVEDILGVSNAVLTESSDRAGVSLNFSDDVDFEDYDELQPGERLTVTFTTASGASTTTEIRVPTTLTEEQDSVRL